MLMSNETLNYLAEVIVSDLRKGLWFPPQLVQDVRSYPLVNFTRRCIQPADKDWLLDLMKSSDYEKFFLGCVLAKEIQHLAEIKGLLFKLWAENKSEGSRGICLMWGLLNYDDLPIELHREIFSFIIKNWEIWKADHLVFAGGVENVISVAKARLADESFPKSKHWIYLLSLKLSNNQNAMNELVNSLQLEGSDEMISMALKEINFSVASRQG